MSQQHHYERHGFVHRRDDREHWNAIYLHWAAMQERYLSSDEEAFSWFNERANVSLLSAAAWSAGIPSVCEYRAFRRRGVDGDTDSGTEKAQQYLGRADLYLSIDPYGEYVEAKWINRSIDQARVLTDQLQILASAREQVSYLEDSLGGKRTGIVFCSYFSPPSLEMAECEAKIAMLVEHVKSLRGPISFAFWLMYAASARPADISGYRALGTVVLGRAQSRA